MKERRRRIAREMIEQLRAGSQLQILNQVEQEYYMTTLKDVDSENFIIYEPISGGKGLAMPKHSSWQFCLPGDDAVYFFNGVVVDLLKEEDKSLFLIKKPNAVHRQQRRGHVRVPCHLNILYWQWSDATVSGIPSPVLATRSAELWQDPSWVKDYLGSLETIVSGKNAFTLDMSGSGLRMVTLEPLKRQDHLLLKFSLDEKKVKYLLLIEAKVVRSVPLNIGGWRRYRVGVSFVGLDSRVQEKVISYLFTQMRKKI